MSHSLQVYHTVLTRLSQAPRPERLTRRRNLAWLVACVYLAASCCLTQLAKRMATAGTRDSRVQRLARCLANHRLDVRACYGPTVHAILTGLGNARMILIIDRTMILKHLNVLTVSVAFRGRALPLAWTVRKRSGSFKRSTVLALLRYVQRWAPPLAPHQVWVVADAEFEDAALQQAIVEQLGWHYVQRMDCNVWLFPRRGDGFKPQDLGLRPGQSCYFPRVRVTLKQLGPTHFLAYWAKGEDKPWYLLSDQPDPRQMLQVYGRRYWTEPMYRDFKSHGWNLEASRITDPKRFARLLLALALAYVWLIQLAAQIIKRGWRKLVDRRRARTLSYFRIGWDWLLYCLDHDLPLRFLDTFCIPVRLSEGQ